MALFFKRLFGKPAAPPVRPRRPAAGRPRTSTSTPPPPGRRPHGPTAPAAYALVVDESDSTSARFHTTGGGATSRIVAIRRAAGDFLRQLARSNPRQLAGVVGFSRFSRLVHPLVPVGPGLGHLLGAVQSLRPDGVTNLSAGLGMALGELQRARTRHRNLVVITDGAANEDVEQLPGLLRRAQSARVRIFTIGVGNRKDGDYDRDLLLRLAKATGGRFSSAHSFGALCQALRRVA